MVRHGIVFNFACGLLTQCSSDSGGENPIEDVIDQGTDDDPNDDDTDDGTTGGTDTDGADLTLLVNPADPIWFSVDYDDGISVNFHGTKDEMGMPEMLTHLEIIEDENNGAVFYLDEQYRIAEMIYSDGTLFRFDWTNTTANLTVVANDGSTQVNTEIDLNNTASQIDWPTAG